MSILSMSIDQVDNKSLSSFSIQFKQLKFTEIFLTALSSQGRRAQQLAQTDNKGKTKGKETDKSILKAIFS